MTKDRLRRLSSALMFLGLLLTLVFSLFDGSSLPQARAATTVTLVGDLQSELGCAGDWDPSCTNPNVLMTAGANDGIYRLTASLPAGTFNYKVALNGTWDVNYGA